MSMDMWVSRWGLPGLLTHLPTYLLTIFIYAPASVWNVDILWRRFEPLVACRLVKGIISEIHNTELQQILGKCRYANKQEQEKYGISKLVCHCLM